MSMTYPAVSKQETNAHPMNETQLQKFCQSLATPSTDRAYDAWIIPSDWVTSPESCGLSSPEIATPANVFLTSLAGQAKVPAMPEVSTDMDVSAVLNMPIFDRPLQAGLAPSYPVQTPIAPRIPAANAALPEPHHLFADLPPALATFAAEQPPKVYSESTAPLRKLPIAPANTSAAQKRPFPMDYARPGAVVDEAAIKRQKNTDAARRSRLRKAVKMEGLEKRVAELEKTNSDLVLRAAVLETEKTSLAAKESSYQQRIQVLEAQLAEAHKALASIKSQST